MNDDMPSIFQYNTVRNTVVYNIEWKQTVDIHWWFHELNIIIFTFRSEERK